jgi:hypothetical protein
MSKRNKTAEQAPVVEPVVVVEETEVAIDAAEAEAIAETEEQIGKKNSVVLPKYKVRYRDRAKEHGQRGKAAKRSAWDWLAQVLAAETLTKDYKLKVDDFVALLEANGIEDPLGRWPNRSNGWEGRLRMTGRLALQRIVAEEGIVKLADGEEIEAPAEWVAKYRN